MKSTSCSLFGPPRAQAASPPPRTNGISWRCRAPAPVFIASSSSSKVGSGIAGSFPVCPIVQHEAVIRVAAAADIHASDVSVDRVERAFADLRGEADVVLLAGDLTTSGEPKQAEVIAAACRHLDVPIFAVLGNHDHHAERTDELREVLEGAGIRLLDRGCASCEIEGLELGVVG